MYSRAYALGTEFKKKGVNVALAPVAGPLGRAPAAGRNWEGFSVDPFLAGTTTPPRISSPSVEVSVLLVFRDCGALLNVKVLESRNQ